MTGVDIAAGGHRPPRHNFFDHTRLIAAWLVFLSHHYALLGLPQPTMCVDSLMAGIGVGMFFSLSGYLVSHSLLADPHAGRFLARRALRIYPGLIVNVLLCLLVLGPLMSVLPLAEYWTQPQLPEYLRNLLMAPRFDLPGVFADNPYPTAVNGSLWTLPFEVLAYLTLCLTAMLIGVAHHRQIVLILWLVSLLLAVFWQPPTPLVVWDNDLRHLPRLFALFFGGALLVHYGQVLLRAGWLLSLVVFLALGSALQPALCLPAALFVLPLLTIYFGAQPVAARFVPASDCSYGIYIYAFPVQQTVIALAGPWGFWPTFVLAAGMTWLLAWLSWHLVEQPALRLKPRRPLRQAVAT